MRRIAVEIIDPEGVMASEFKKWEPAPITRLAHFKLALRHIAKAVSG